MKSGSEFSGVGWVAHLPSVIGHGLVQGNPTDVSRRALVALRETLLSESGDQRGRTERCGDALARLKLSEDEADQLGMLCWLGAVACHGEESAALDDCAAFFAAVIEHALALQRIRELPATRGGP